MPATQSAVLPVGVDEGDLAPTSPGPQHVEEGNTQQTSTASADQGVMIIDGNGTSIVIPDVSPHFPHRRDWIINERKNSVQRYAIASKRVGGVPSSNPVNDANLQRTDRLLSFLEHDFEVSPAYKKQASVDLTLKLMFDKESDGYYFPDDIKRRAKALYLEFEESNWGEKADGEMNIDVNEGDDDGTSEKPSVLRPKGTGITSTASIRVPPSNHPIWGVNGIMFGVVPKVGGKIPTTQFDRRHIREKRSAKVYGHNGLAPGAWYASQLLALFHGAHGSRMGGISGNTVKGAYSVVVSGMYKDVDEDHVDRIIYSGPGCQDNTDPHKLPKGSTDILQASLTSGQPIRVLRSAQNPLSISPSVGIRYDGLYTVARRLTPQKNPKGGLFARFVLERVPGQESVTSISRRSPTPQQQKDFAKIKQYF